ncbi:YbaB/EbfC family nucleoid-associated protein [Nocardia jiangxiensis]|uniref:YbaB/EbfC family nucleoid-associated protein n=1 Tax=Nocardia jiangxiensis TaxID=282685 RepID=A0ABW6RRS5_9NOCA|nr:YbaB/EbfC family nucleoid-associated protein [Nocardia jiangxiensis]
MAYKFDRAELESMVEDAQEQLRTVARIQQQRAQLIGTATVSNKRVTVSVNADGVVVETRFGPGIENLGFSAIAKAVTEAAQLAAQDLAEKNRELMSPLQSQRARLPKLSDLIEGMPDLRGQLPTPPEPSLKPPNSAERNPLPGADEMQFTDVESYDHDHEVQHRPTEAGW